MRKLLLAFPFIVATIFSSCGKDITAPKTEEVNPTEFVSQYYSNTVRFPDIDSVRVVNGEDVRIYGEMIDWYTGTGRNTYNHINVDIDDLDMKDDAPTFELGKETPRMPYLNTFYSMFSMGMGPDATGYSNNVWDEVANRVSGVPKSSNGIGKIVIGD